LSATIRSMQSCPTHSTAVPRPGFRLSGAKDFPFRSRPESSMPHREFSRQGVWGADKLLPSTSIPRSIRRRNRPSGAA
jgi:hypothetical protein